MANENSNTAKPETDKKITPPGFIDFIGLCAFVPLGERTLRKYIQKKIIPHIRLKNGRRLLFHAPSVARSLLRFQTGGIE